MNKEQMEEVMYLENQIDLLSEILSMTDMKSEKKRIKKEIVILKKILKNLISHYEKK